MQGAPSNPVEATKIELPSGKASGTWHDEIFELHFSIKNPGGAVQKKHYTSDMVAVGTSDLKIGVAMQRTMAQFGFYLITEQPYSYTTLPTIFRFILHGDSPEQPDIFETHAENKPRGSLGFPRLVSEKHILERSDAFQAARAASASQEVSGHVGTDTDSPPKTYHLRGRLVIRLVSATAWETLGADMRSNPSKHLFLDFRSVPVALPEVVSVSSRTLEERMLALMREAETNGDVTFVVGSSNIRIRAHANIIANASLVPLVHERMMEGNIKEVKIPQYEEGLFRALLTFMYTNTVADNDLHEHAEELMDAADAYDLPLLHDKCERYLCWRLQTDPLSLYIPSLLTTAHLHGASALKTKCFEWVFLSGAPLLADSAFESLPRLLLVELLRDFANRRAVSTRFLERGKQRAQEKESETGKGKKRKADVA